MMADPQASAAAWYDRTWRQIKEDNGMTDQQATRYMTYMINHGEEGLLQPGEWLARVWYDQTWRQVKADNQNMTDQQVTDYMTYSIEHSEQPCLSPTSWVFQQEALAWHAQTTQQIMIDNPTATEQQVAGYMNYTVYNSQQHQLSFQDWLVQSQNKGNVEPELETGAVERFGENIKNGLKNVARDGIYSEQLNDEGILKAFWQGFKTNTGGLISDTQHIISELGRPEYMPPEEWQKKEPPVHKAVTEFGERLEAQNERNYEPWSAKWFAYNSGGVIPTALTLEVTTAAALKSGNAQAIRSSTAVTASRLGFGPKAVQFAGELAPATQLARQPPFPRRH